MESLVEGYLATVVVRLKLLLGDLCEVVRVRLYTYCRRGVLLSRCPLLMRQPSSRFGKPSLKWYR
jgi:hypothetical protein